MNEYGSDSQFQLVLGKVVVHTAHGGEFFVRIGFHDLIDVAHGKPAYARKSPCLARTGQGRGLKVVSA
jgi:hypothetical protein